MNKTAQDLAWNCLPLEVKKEAKRQYQIATNAKEYYTECTLEYLFGIHNLTSDAEGEEMLTVSRERVMEIYNHCNGGGAQVIEDIFGKLTYDMNNDAIITPIDKLKGLPRLNEKQEVITDYEGYAPTLYPYEDKWFVSWVSSEGDSILDFKAESPEKAIELAYSHLFGSKCLPDDVSEVKRTLSENLSEPKRVEPKLNKGDLVVFKNTGKIKVVAGIEADGRYIVTTIDGNSPLCVRASDLQPYNSADPTQPNLAMSAKSATPSLEEIRKSRTFPEQMPSDGSDNSDNSDPHQSRNLSQNIADCDKHFDNVLKDSFSKERRLNIAAMAMPGILAAGEDYSGDCKFIAMKSLELADALIAEADFPTEPLRPAKKGGPDDSDDSAPSDSSENPTLSSTK